MRLIEARGRAARDQRSAGAGRLPASASRWPRAGSDEPAICSRMPTSRSTRPRPRRADRTASSRCRCRSSCCASRRCAVGPRRTRSSAASSASAFQPLVDLHSNRVVVRGAAALEPSAARHGVAGGVHPRGRGERADRPDRRMGPAEASPLQAMSWPAEVSVAVNLSSRQFADDDLTGDDRQRR